MIKMIFAHGNNGEFGQDDGLPWHRPADFKHFKLYTADTVMVMSGSTFASLPGLLPGRLHVVLGRPGTVAKNGAKPDFLLGEENSLRDVCGLLDAFHGDDICIIGGRQFLMQASTFVDEASIARVDGEFPDATHIIDYEYIDDNLRRRLDGLSFDCVDDLLSAAIVGSHEQRAVDIGPIPEVC